MNHVYATGGREKYFKKLDVGDCVTRAIAIATGKDYKEIYDRINTLAKKERRAIKATLVTVCGNKRLENILNKS